MRSTHVIEIQTPKKFLLNGLWFGPTKPRRAIIWIHGLSSSAFTKLGIVEKLVDKDTAVITFNNRGSGTISKVRRLNPRKKDGVDSILVGGAHEVFTESADDIQGAINFAKKQGAKEIHLIGHSTGAQKAVYFATRKGNGKKIRSLALLGPLSDYAGALKERKRELAKATQVARALVKRGKKQAIVPGWWMDAQRFLSLHTPDSAEEIFSYVQPQKRPRTYESLSVPTFVLFAGEDEYADRPAEAIAKWFEKHARMKRFKLAIIPGVPHSFHGAEGKVARTITAWIRA